MHHVGIEIKLNIVHDIDRSNVDFTILLKIILVKRHQRFPLLLRKR